MNFIICQATLVSHARPAAAADHVLPPDTCVEERARDPASGVKATVIVTLSLYKKTWKIPAA